MPDFVRRSRVKYPVYPTRDISTPMGYVIDDILYNVDDHQEVGRISGGHLILASGGKAQILGTVVGNLITRKGGEVFEIREK